ncbi:BZ3500_MvSof-1268-A1-R1_Chr6-2g08597 [Microbotryum saponariae]|uniref:BZ3500_MvSof-1268-A1-R1_Chr6-2g08597 protein n=1 Tax=Microbotryum saponariae TaxID=289078 RepID=A0A2X0MN89_9BASI|nr:BZ3500_MvSof-1268-A1-R1_Chr6-2g08597 [Microbotryum saponariae]SDA07869.1 BZ3501_MvSof-1269-A2-R1_Chr6-1g08306 [Microbotryum saponariae]
MSTLPSHYSNTKTDGLVFSGIDGVGYRDFTVSSTSRFKSRSRLDAIAFDQLADRQFETVLFCVPSLSSVCVEVVARNWLRPGIFDHLDGNFHRDRASEILQAIASQSETGLLPFNVFVDFATVLSTDMPQRRRTYRGLCRSDHLEIRQVSDANERSQVVWQTEWTQDEQQRAITGQIAAPCFFLAVLDLGGTAFSDQDIIALKDPLANFLAVLKLRSTRVTDDGLAWIARAFEHDKRSYRHMQVLSLASLKRVTNSGVQHLAALPLRMLDVRGTSCTSQVRSLLNATVSSLPQGTDEPRPGWRCAIAKRVALEMQGLSSSLELELFSSINYSPARILAYLQQLGEIRVGDTRQVRRLRKSIVVHIDAIPRLRDAQMHNEHAAPPQICIREDVDMVKEARYASFSPVYGKVTSTSGVSTEALLSSANSEPEARYAAFKVRDDAILGHGATLLSAKGSAQLPSKTEIDPLSDSEDEADRIAAWDLRESERRPATAREQATRHPFYHQPGAQERRSCLMRTIAVPPRSDLMLLRQLPVMTPLASQVPLPTSSWPSGPAGDRDATVDEGDLIRPRKRLRKDRCQDVMLPCFSLSTGTSRPWMINDEPIKGFSAGSTRTKSSRSEMALASSVKARPFETPGLALLHRNPFAKRPPNIVDRADKEAPFELAPNKPAKLPRF